MKSMLVSVITGVFLAACAPATRGTAEYVSEIDGEGLVLQESSIAEIEQAQGMAFMHPKDPDFKITIKYGKLEGDTVGLAEVSWEECNITLHQELRPESARQGDRSRVLRMFRSVLIHEIGHCFGLEHSPREDDIMHDYYSISCENDEAFDRYNSALMEVRNKW